MADEFIAPSYNTPGYVRGRITTREKDGSITPIRFVEVTVSNSGLRIDRIPDFWGRFSVGQQLPPGEYFIHVRDPYKRGLEFESKTIKVGRPGEISEDTRLPQEIDARYSEGLGSSEGHNILVGTITDEKGLPLKANVRVDGKNATGGTASDDLGNFMAVNSKTRSAYFPDGNYTVSFFHPLFKFQKAQITLSGSKEHVLPPAIGIPRKRGKLGYGVKTYIIEGQVTDWAKKPLEGIRVEIKRVSLEQPFKPLFAVTCVTDKNGHFTINDDVNPGKYALLTRDPKGVYKFIKREVTVPYFSNNKIVIKAIPKNIITGYTFSNKGGPVTGITVTINGPQSLTLRSSIGGYFISKKPLPNGTYTLSAQDPKHLYEFTTTAIVTLADNSAHPALLIGRKLGEDELKKKKEERNLKKKQEQEERRRKRAELVRQTQERFNKIRLASQQQIRAGLSNAQKLTTQIIPRNAPTRIMANLGKARENAGSNLSNAYSRATSGPYSPGRFTPPSLANTANALNNAAKLIKLTRLLALPWLGWILLAVLLGIVVLAVIVILINKGGNPLPSETTSSSSSGSGGSGGSTGSSSIPGLAIDKSGPAQIVNGGNIYYSLVVTYSGNLDVTIHDSIPPNTKFENASGTFIKDNENSDLVKEISWKLKDNTPVEGRYIFNLTLRPTANDIIVVNKAVGRATGGSGGNVDSNDFSTLMRGQGRNIGVLGDEENFTRQVIQNGGAYRMAEKESSVRQIFKEAIAKNVNPLAVLATWGTEAGFQNNGTEFGCDPYQQRYRGFQNQLSCGINTWNNWMDHFDKNKDANGTITLPSNIGRTCTYDDPFLFAAERYGPECTIYDSNDFFRSNFVKFYRTFLGLGV